MKLIFTIGLMMLSLSSFAFRNEVECDGWTGSKTIRIEVERAFPENAYFTRAEMTVTEAGGREHHDYNVTRRNFGFNKMEYHTAGFRLEVDYWPDQRPQWGRNYRGELLSSALGNQYVRSLNCRFPNAY